MSDNSIEQASGVGFLFRALRHRNYRFFFFGQGVSLIGTWMQTAAMAWLIPGLARAGGRSAELWLGLMPFLGQMSSFGLPLLTGVLADRWNRRRILMVTQSLALIQAAVLAVLVMGGWITIGHLVVLAMAMGLINAFDIPTRQSFVLDMVEDRRDLSNAIALNSSLVNGARLVGPVVAGVIIGAIGASMCFGLNAVSFLAVLGALAAMRIPPRVGAAPQRKAVLVELKDGFRYAMGFRPIRAVLLLAAMVSLMGVPYAAMMPLIAKDVLHGGPELFGVLLGCVGSGALCGALYLASRRTVHGIKTKIAMAAFLFGGGLIAFSLSRTVWLSMALLVMVGLGMMVTMASSNTFLQTVADDDKRGRVMSFWTMSFMGMVPTGSLLTGLAARSIGPMWTIFIGGCAVVTAAAIFTTRLPMLRRLSHPIYIRKGLIPETVMAAADEEENVQ